MSAETSQYQSHQLANHQPESFFRPPTAKERPEFIYLAQQLRADLVGMGLKPRKLLVGAEFEIFFPDPSIEPTEALKLPRQYNPNYSRQHLDKVLDMLKLFESLYKKKPS